MRNADKKIKTWWLGNKDVVIKAVLIFLAVVAVFGLGFLAGTDSNPAPIIIEQAPVN